MAYPMIIHDPSSVFLLHDRVVRVAETAATATATSSPSFHEMREASINDFESISSLHRVSVLKKRGVVVVVKVT